VADAGGDFTRRPAAHKGVGAGRVGASDVVAAGLRVIASSSVLRFTVVGSASYAESRANL
jgi:hypothetical protein